MKQVDHASKSLVDKSSITFHFMVAAIVVIGHTGVRNVRYYVTLRYVALCCDWWLTRYLISDSNHDNLSSNINQQQDAIITI